MRIEVNFGKIQELSVLNLNVIYIFQIAFRDNDLIPFILNTTIRVNYQAFKK